MRSPDTLFIGQVFHDLPQAASTNAYALDLLSTGQPPEGTVVSTFHQTAGRGQIGSRWESEPGKNINLSIILYPDFLAAQKQFLLSQAVSLAVRDFVETHLAAPVFVKWPNDIYVHDKKIAGILIQNSLTGSQLRSSVVGIGVNVHQTVFLSNPPNPTSFRLETGLELDLGKLISSLCKHLEARYLQLKSGKILPLQCDYRSHLYCLDEERFFEKNQGEVFKGSIAGVTETGRLRVIVGNAEETFDLKEIKFL